MRVKMMKKRLTGSKEAVLFWCDGVHGVHWEGVGVLALNSDGPGGWKSRIHSLSLAHVRYFYFISVLLYVAVNDGWSR